MINSGVLRKRLLAWLFVLTFCMAALPSGAFRQCLNGMPCPQNCPLLKQNSKAAQGCMGVPSPHCALCQAAGAAALRQSHMAASGPSSRCVFRVQAKNCAIPTPNAAAAPLLLARLPPARRLSIPPAVTVAAAAAPPLIFYQQRFLRLCSGRAPPVLL